MLPKHTGSVSQQHQIRAGASRGARKHGTAEEPLPGGRGQVGCGGSCGHNLGLEGRNHAHGTLAATDKTL